MTLRVTVVKQACHLRVHVSGVSCTYNSLYIVHRALQGRADGLYDGAAMSTGKKGGLVRVGGYS